MSAKPDELDGAWASACKAVFGRSLGTLEPYGPWLMEYLDPPHVRRSASGEEVVMAALQAWAAPVEEPERV